MLRATLLLACLTALAAPAAAQTARIHGIVTDESGAVLPAVDIRATLRADTGETSRSVITDGTGSYDLDNLAPGSWVLTMALPGFETATERLSVQAGDALDWSPTLELGMIQETVSITTAASSEPLQREAQAPSAPTPAATPATAGPVRVGGSIRPPRKILDVRPVYPADAAANGISGVVVLRAIIGTDGVIRDVTTLRSPNDALTSAASSAFLGWQYTPTLLNGVPTDTRITATFNFQQQF